MLKIILDCERMKYPHTGLFHFCHQLGLSLKELTINTETEITYYIPEKEKVRFGNESAVMVQNAMHKFLMPSLKGYQIWHSTFQGTNYFPASQKIKKVLTVHDLNFMYDENKSLNKKNRALRKLEQKIKMADAVVTISNFVLNDLKQHIAFDYTKAHVIYNGCNFSEYSQPKAPQHSPLSPFLYTIGTITEKKNFHVLPALLKTFDGLLIISGITQNEAYKEKIIKEARRHHVEDRLVFTGPITEGEKMWYMQHCEAFVFPSISEGFGLPVVEAMYLGTPVILSRYTSLPEIGGDAAFYFDSFEPEVIGGVLINCLSQNKRSILKTDLINRANQFNWKDASIQYLKLYNSL